MRRIPRTWFSTSGAVGHRRRSVTTWEPLYRLLVSSLEQTPFLQPSIGQWCRMDTPHVSDETAKWVCDVGYGRFNVVLRDKAGHFLRQVSPTRSHQSNDAVEKTISTVRFCSHILCSPHPQNRVFRREARFATVAVDHQTRCVGYHEIQRARDTHDTIREDSWTEILEGDPTIGSTGSRAPPRSQ